MVCCIVADLITNPTLTLNLVSVVCLFRHLIFWGVHLYLSQRYVLFIDIVHLI